MALRLTSFYQSKGRGIASLLFIFAQVRLFRSFVFHTHQGSASGKRNKGCPEPPTKSPPNQTRGEMYFKCRRMARAGRRFPILVGTYSEYPRFKRTCTHVQVCAQSLFFWTVHGPFSFRQDEKKMGGGLPGYQHSLYPSHRKAPRQRAKKERGTCLSLFIRSLGRFKAIQTDSGSV